MITMLPVELADLLDDTTPGEDAATDAQVAAFIAEHTAAARPSILAGLVNTLAANYETKSRHTSTIAATVGAMKEARAGFYSAQTVIDTIKPMFITAATRPPTGGERQRTTAEAEHEWRGIVAWSVGQALAADLDQVRARVTDKMPDNNEWFTSMANATKPDENTPDGDDDETVRTVPWPTLNDAALHGTAGKIVNLAAPHTEADPAAILVQLLAVFGAAVGPEPHFVAGN